MILFATKLVLAHILGDFVFQPGAWIANREKHGFKSPDLYKHIAVHCLCLLVLLGFSKDYILAFWVIPLSHLLIDILKVKLKNKLGSRMLFLIDQALHLLIIFWVCHYYFPLFQITNLFTSPKLLLLITALLFVTFVASVTLKVLLSKWSVSKDGKYRGMSEAGKYIGMLERLFIFFFVFIGQWEGIGFLLTAKSIFRFGDLTTNKDHRLTEYVLIGTLLSFGLAILSGLFFKYLLGFVR